MVMNEKAAMALCAAVIIGMPCGLQRFVAQTEVPSPLGLGRPGMRAAVDRGPRADADPRAVWVRRFQRPNPFESQSEANRAKDALALLTHSEPPIVAAEPILLPPLLAENTPVAAVLEADPEVVAAAAEPSGADTPEAGVAAELKRYRVAKGDTLLRIARREWNSDDRRLVALLESANPQVRERKSRILVGEELVIPDAASVQNALAAPAKAEVNTALCAGKTADERWYTIQRKDTLASIARRFLKDGRRWREIVVLNRALDPHRIVPGTRIKLPPVLRLAQN
jgi:nucleoid-associated protein YgaU